MTENRAWVFNKIRGSFVDGYGIRTTVFLKGCPLRCKWCCNPEGQLFSPELKVDHDNCDGCGRCRDACPNGALSVRDGTVSIDRSLCTACGTCSEFCWTGVLEPFGRYYTVDELFEYLKKDMAFYKRTGGGVTIGGGEAACQPDFVLALMEKCHEAGIHVAVDTCGYIQDPLGLEVLKHADLLLYDIKGWDEAAHISNTGVSNRVIWENLRMLDRMGKPIIIRLPVIPGYNDDWEDIRHTAAALAELTSIQRIDILPFHPLGKSKYRQIDMEYTIPDGLDVSEERQEALKKLFESHGFLTQLGG